MEIEGHEIGRELEVAQDHVWQRLFKEKLPWVVNGDDYTDQRNRNDLEQTRYSAGLRSLMIVPLLWQGKNSGSMAFRSKNPESFGEHEVGLGIEIAAQISGAIASANQYKQLAQQAQERERLALEQTLLAEIGRLTSSTLELDEVFESFVDRAKQLIPLDRAVISVNNPEGDSAIDAYVSGEKFSDDTTGVSYRIDDGFKKIASNAEAFNPNLDELKEMAISSPSEQARLDMGYRSLLMAPMIAQGNFVGTLTVRSVEPDPFGDHEIQVVQQIAAQIAGAVATSNQYAQLQAESAERVRFADEQRRISEIGRIVSSTLDFNEVLSRFAKEAKYLVPHDRLVISAWSEDGSSLIEQYIEGTQLEGNVSGRVIEVPKDDVWQKLYGEHLPWVARGDDYAEFKQKNDFEKARYESGLRAVLMIPLLWQGKNTGSIVFRSKNPNAFGEDEVKLAVEIAAQISGAVTTVSQYRQRLAGEQTRIAEIGRIVSSSLDIEDVLTRFVDQARLLVHFDRIVITVANDDLTEVTDVLVDGIEVDQDSIGISQPFTANAVQQRIILNQDRAVLNGEEYARHAHENRVELTRYDAGLRSLMMIPLVWQGRSFGSINFRSLDPNGYGEREVELAEQIAAQIAGAIATSIQFRLLESALDDVGIHATALEAADDAIIIRNKDTTVAYVNSGFERQTGFSRDEVVGTNFNYPENAGSTPQSLIDLWAHVREGKTWRKIVNSFRKDGSQYTVDATLSPVFNEDGEFDKYVGVRRDVTEQVKADETNKTLAAALESTDEAVMLINADTSTEWVNESFVRDTGYSREEAVGQSSPFLRSEKNAPEVFDGLWEQVRTGQSWAGRIWTKRKDGTEYLCDATLSPVFGDDGTIAKFVGTRHDITAILQAEQDREARRDLDAQNKQLLELNDQREEFFSTVSHELRTPLTSVMAFADILSRDRDETLTDLQKDHLDVIKRNSRNLNELVEDMLDFSRMSNHQLKLDKSEFEVHSLIDSVVESMEPTAAQRGQALVIEPHTEPVWIVADHGRIVQIVSNLITNSCKYSPTGTRITIKVRSESEQVSVTVSDKGVGIPPEDLASIYSPFFRSNQLEIREQIGTGLGLAISKTLVDLHDGTIEAKSVIDEGTDITVILPGPSSTPTVNAKP